MTETVKYSRYFVLEAQIKQIPIYINRKEAVEEYTKGESNSFKYFTTQSEFDAFCKWLEDGYQLNKSTDWQNSPENKQRRKIIGIFKSMEYTHENGKADMEAINSWCINRSYLKKPLNDYTAQELPKLVSIVQKVHQSFVKGINK